MGKLKKEYQYVYSTAHLEELANSIWKNGLVCNAYIENDIEALSELINNMELLPDLSRGIIICIESPYKPLEMVISSFEGTTIAEQEKKDFMKKEHILEQC